MTSARLRRRSRARKPVWLVAWSVLLTCSTAAQDSDRLGEGYAHIVNFAAEPAIAGEAFEIDSDNPSVTDNDVRALRLPLYREFGDPDERRWFAQAAFSAVRLDGELTVEFGNELPTLVARPEYTAYTGTVQGGIVTPVTETLSFLAGVGLGWSRLENRTEFSDPLLGDLIDLFAPQRLFDWEADAALLRAELGARHETHRGKLRFKNRLDLVVSHVESVEESAGLDAFSGRSTTLSFQSDVSRPLAWSPGGRAVYLLAGIGGFVFLGDGRDQLGFTELFQASVGVGFRQFALRFSTVFGPDVQGAGLSLDYGY